MSFMMKMYYLKIFFNLLSSSTFCPSGRMRGGEKRREEGNVEAGKRWWEERNRGEQ